MAFNYTKMQTTAIKLLTKFGTTDTVQLKRLSSVVEDPVEGTITGTPTSTYVTAVNTGIDKSMVDDVRILTSDNFMIIGSAFKPIESDVVIINSIEYKIVGIKTISPAGTDIIYKVAYRV